MKGKLHKIEEFVLDKMQDSGLPGLSMAIVKDQKTVYARGFGQKETGGGRATTARTLFGIGSITKSFTCMALMQLQEKGKLSIEDPVNAYLDFKVEPEGKQIRIKHLMTHTSGIPALAYAEAKILHAVDEDIPDVPIGDVDDMVTYMQESRDWTETEPGERWFYLNEGYVLLGGIIEQVSGNSYQKYMREQILKPLGMNRSYFEQEKVENDSDVACPYLVHDNERSVQSYLYGSITSDGGLISSAEDMARYLKLYLAGGNENIISKRSLKEMMQPRVSTPARSLYDYDENENRIEANYRQDTSPRYYGYGLGREDDFMGYTKIGHGGSVLVSTAQMDFIPEENLGIVLLANGSGYPMSQFSRYALALLLDEDPDRLSFRQAEVKLEELAGRYHGYKDNYQIKIERKGDMLRLKNVSSSLGEEEILLPQELGEEKIVCFIIRGGRRIPVEFYKRDDKIELLYGRYKLKKISSNRV